MTNHSARAVAFWLNSLRDTHARPIVVKIGRTTFPGATYIQKRQVPEGSRAYAEGKRTYEQYGLYLLGDLPYAYRRKRATAFVDSFTGRRFFVGSWFDRDEPNEYHPYGRMFQLFPDDAGVCVDDDGQPYREVTFDLRGLSHSAPIGRAS